MKSIFNAISISCLVATASLAPFANAEMVKMCLFYKPSGHARTDPILSDTCVSDHVHTFYGPQLFHPSTTPADLRNSDPKYSSSVFEENKSLYWHPSIYKVGQDSSGQPTYELADIAFAGPYYRWDADAPGPKVEAFPPGFQMIAGMNPNLEGLNLFSECLCPKPCTRADGLCNSDSNFFPSQACGEMGIAMNFPTCWDDSKGLGDTGDHMSHMAYTVDGTVNGACPPGFNRRLPQIQLFVRISNYEGGKYTFSDNTLPGDEEVFHADFMNGWDEGVLENIVNNCPALPNSGDPYNPPCNCDQFLTKKENLLSFTEEGRNDAEAAKICPIDVKSHIVDEEINFSVGGLPRGGCSAPLITGVAPPFVDECGLQFTPNNFNEENCSGGGGGGGGNSNDEDEDNNNNNNSEDEDEEEDDDNTRCKDNAKFKFGKNDNNCKWVGANERRTSTQCRRANVAKNCPKTCGTCSSNDSEDDSGDNNSQCKDDPKFKLGGKKNKTCQWIGANENRAERLCKRRNVAKACPVTCDEC